MKYLKEILRVLPECIGSEELVEKSFNGVQCSGFEKVNIFWLKLGLLNRAELIENVDYSN